jgi:hypothetical protein
MLKTFVICPKCGKRTEALNNLGVVAFHRTHVYGVPCSGSLLPLANCQAKS